MKALLMFIKKPFLFASVLLLLHSCYKIDDDPLTDRDGNPIGTYIIASGPAYGTYYPYAEGIVDAASETMGIFMDNRATNGSLENAEQLVTGNTYLKNAYMALMQEDVYEYLRQDCIRNFSSGTVNKKYLAAVSRTKVILALFNETVHLLVTKASGIDNVAELTTGQNVNIGPNNSGTFVTASNILNAWGKTPVLAGTIHYDDAAVGIQKVVNGEYQAAFFVSATPCSLFADIPAAEKDNVKLIQVTMPSGKKTYSETGSIKAGDYPFQEEDISNNISVKTLLAGGPNFDDTNIDNFINYLFEHSEEYTSYNAKWGDLSLALSQEYMCSNPEKVNFRAMCYVSGFPALDPFYVEDNFFTDYGVSAYHDMYIELDYLLTLNTGMGMKEVNTTGAWENAYRMMRGEGIMALVQDDIFEYLKSSSDMYDSMIAASMKKLVPLHYEYAHLLVNTASGFSNLEQMLTAALPNVTDLYLNVGPKTSGTFLTAMKIIDSYRGINTVHTDDPDVPDIDHINIHYSFDEASVAAGKVNSGEYHAAFIVSGVPYNKFYSHDTWSIADLSACDLIETSFYGTTPDPYKNGIIPWNDPAVYAGYYSYPYSSDLLTADLPAVRVRALQVVSPVFNSSDIDVYLKAVFRKGYYMTVPQDNTFTTNALWVAVSKESMTAAEAVAAGYTSTYGEDIEGAMEYFVKNPYGWHDGAADYYLSMFQDN